MNRILVTGGTSDIGRSICEYFNEKEWTVLVHYNESEDRASTMRDKGYNVIQADLSTQSGRRGLVEATLESNSDLDVLVNNAALFLSSDESESREQEWNEQMKLNARVPWELSMDLQESIANQEGSIVNITDASVDRPYSNRLPYFASKSALENLTRGLARKLAPEIRVNGVAPGPIDFPDGYDPDDRQRLIEDTLLERKGTHREIAKSVYHLAVEATYTTGSILAVDGGKHLK